MTGLIYVAIIAVWAVVLVPAWLRRHDHADPERSVDRFTRSMQTLARRPSVLGIPMPSHEPAPAADEPATKVSTATRPGLRRPRLGRAALRRRTTGRAGGVGTAPRTSKVRRVSAAMRRRIVLGVLVVGLAVVGVLVGVGVLLPIALAVPVVLILGFLGIARHQVRSARRTRARRGGPVAARPPQATPTARPAATTSEAAGGTWEARSTPLPSYVTAPPAAGYPRVIDTQTPGAWTAAAMLERAQKEKQRAERMAAAKAEAIAKARAEQEAAAQASGSRDDAWLAAEAARPTWMHDTIPLRARRAANG